jgi:hypothetical protein
MYPHVWNETMFLSPLYDRSAAPADRPQLGHSASDHRLLNATGIVPVDEDLGIRRRA